jgi:DNA-binding XRE family transcriptional regulator
VQWTDSEAKTSVLRLAIPNGKIIVHLTGDLPVRQRREWANAIAHCLKDLPKINWQTVSFYHRDVDHCSQWLKETNRPKLERALRVGTPDEKLGFEIRMRRLELGWSQSELAKRACVDRAHLSRVERGRGGLKESTLVKILSALNPRE